MRTIVDLPAEQLEALDAWCGQERISRAEAVRRAVAAHLKHLRTARPDLAFGIWRDRSVDGLEYERRLRREWDAGRDRAPRRKGRRASQ